MKSSLIIALTILLLSCSKKSKMEYNIPEMNGMSQTEIRKEFGQPDSTYTKDLIKKVFQVDFYKKDKTEFRYKGGVLDEIVILEPYSYEFDPMIIEDFGFEFSIPSTNNPEAIYSWTDIQGIKRFSMYIVRSEKPDSIDRKFNIYINMN